MRVAILTEDAFEQVEMTEPRTALDAAGAQTTLVSKHTPRVQGWKHHDRADDFDVDLSLDQANPEDFDALMLPGGALNADKLRTERDAVAFVEAFARGGKPIAAICHAPWILIEAGVARERRMTSWPSLQTDLRNAGAHWVDEVVVVDRDLVTSRKPDDLPQFIAKTIELFAQSRRRGASEKSKHGQIQLTHEKLPR
jgi:protease I